MSFFKVICPYCGYANDADEIYELKTVECQSCGKTFEIPNPGPAPAAELSSPQPRTPPPKLTVPKPTIVPPRTPPPKLTVPKPTIAPQRNPSPKLTVYRPEVPDAQPATVPLFKKLAWVIAAVLVLAAMSAGIAIWLFREETVHKALITAKVLQESFDGNKDFLYHGCRIQKMTLLPAEKGDCIQIKIERNGNFYDRWLNVSYSADGKFNYSIDYSKQQSALEEDADLFWDRITVDKREWSDWRYLSAQMTKPCTLHYEAQKEGKTYYLDYEIKTSGSQFFYQLVDSSYPPFINMLGESCAKDGNWEAAVQFYQRAAQQGLDHAQCNLIRCQLHGSGMPKNQEAAFSHARKLARAGVAEAQFLLGQMYESGSGCEKNNEQAYFWYQEAAKNGYRSWERK